MKKLAVISLISLSFLCSVSTANAINPGLMGGYEGYYYEEEDAFPDATLIKEKKEKFVSDEEKLDSEEEGLFNGDETVQSVMYNSILTGDPRTSQMADETVPERKIYNSEEIPVFKRTRIKFMNWLRKREHKSYLQDLEKEKQQLAEYEKELEREQMMYDLFGSKKDKEDLEVSLEQNESDEQVKNAEVAEDTEVSEVEEKKVYKLKGKLKKNQGENVVVLDAKNIYYVEEDDEIVAENSAVVKFPKQKISMRADRFIYSNTANIIKALGNVKITRSGKDVYCDFVQVSVNEEEITFENVNAELPIFNLSAESGVSKNNTLYLNNGYFSLEGDKRVRMRPRRIRGFRPDNLIPMDEDDKFYWQDEYGSNEKTHFDIDKISVDFKKDHDVISFKDIDVKYGEGKTRHFRSLKMYTDKQHKTFEGNYPEFGNIARLGMYLGPGFVFEVPRAGIIKAIPFLNYRKEKLGVGGALRYRGAFNTTELAYGSVSDLWRLKGTQFLDDKLTLNYGMNAFMQQWFMGPRMPKYALELAYNDSYKVPSTFKKGLDLTYTHQGTFGYYHNSMYAMNGDKFNEGNIGTLRGRYMAEIDQELYKYIDKKNYRMFRLHTCLQGSAAIYGTGDTQFVGRYGIGAHSQWKYWKQDIMYFLSAYEDGTPMKRFDAYRYGTSSVRITEAIRLSRYLSLAWAGMITLSDDAPNDRFMQENAFMFVIGPDDIKFTFAYDYVRKRTYFTIGMSVNTTGTTVKYNTLEIKNPERLSTNNGEKIEELQPEFWLIPYDKKVKGKPLQYAQVINIDNDEWKESID